MLPKSAYRRIEQSHHNHPDADSQKVSADRIRASVLAIVNALLLLMIGFLMDSMIPALIYGAVFTVIRLFIGGFRCASYFYHSITFCLTEILVLALGKLLVRWVDLSILLLLLIWCGLGIWFLGPVENTNKPTTPEQRKRCHIIAMVIYGIDSVVTVVCYYRNPFWGMTAVLSLIAAVLLLPIGKLAARRKHKTK